MKSKEQLELENIYYNINKETLNEQGIYPEDPLGTAILYSLIFAVIYALSKIDSSLKEGGRLNKLRDDLLSDKSLKEKISNILSKNKSPGKEMDSREKMGLPPIKSIHI